MKLPVLPRRRFIGQLCYRATVLLGVPLVVSQCAPGKNEEGTGGKTAPAVDPCSDYSDVPEKDLELRKKFAYVEKSPITENHCGNCNLYLPPREGSSCGGCMLFKGPVQPSGYCTYWAPKVEGV